MGMKWSSCFVWICVWLIRFYQYCISPLFPGHCRFVPSCSSYALEAFQTHGALKGFVLTVLRLSRCHPGCKGGYDPVPPAPRSSYLRNH